MSISAPADPAIARVINAIGEGATASDSIAGLLLRVLHRVTSLETVARQVDRRLDLLEKNPRVPWSMAEPVTRALTGIDTATGSPVRIEPRRPVGRPQGRRDSRKRKPRGSELFHKEDLLVDNGFDDPGD
jgi:hypothetical protein